LTQVRSGLLAAVTLFVTLSVPVLLTLGSIRFLMTDLYLQLEYNKPDFPIDPYGLTLADRLHYAPYAVAYLTNDAGINFLGDLTFSNGMPFFNSRELQHMADVKQVARTAFSLGLADLAIIAALGIVLGRSAAGRSALRIGLLSGAALTLGLLVALAVGVLIAWDTLFTEFHQLFFSAGTWQFLYSDSLIRLFPERFWQDAALTVGGMAGFGAALILIADWVRRRTRIGSPVVSQAE